MGHISCFYCSESFEDYAALAVHVNTSKKRHKKGKKWAANYTFKHIIFKQEEKTRTPLTEDEKLSKVSTIREISGDNIRVLTVCPTHLTGYRQLLPIEFTESGDAWRNPAGNLVVNCFSCQK